MLQFQKGKCMTKENKKIIKNKIKLDIVELQKQIEDLKQKISPIACDCSLDDLNREAMKEEQTLTLNLIEQKQQRIALLNSLNVEDEEYGICQECDEDIPFQRLFLIPESKYCVSCLNEMQKN